MFSAFFTKCHNDLQNKVRQFCCERTAEAIANTFSSCELEKVPPQKAAVFNLFCSFKKLSNVNWKTHYSATLDGLSFKG